MFLRVWFFFNMELDLHLVTFHFQAAVSVCGHSLKEKLLTYKYAGQILAADAVSLCQTKEYLIVGHSCIIISDTSIMSSLPCFTVWHGWRWQSCQYLPVSITVFSRHWQKEKNKELVQSTKEDNSQEKKQQQQQNKLFQSRVDCRKMNVVGSVLNFSRQVSRKFSIVWSAS